VHPSVGTVDLSGAVMYVWAACGPSDGVNEGRHDERPLDVNPSDPYSYQSLPSGVSAVSVGTVQFWVLCLTDWIGTTGSCVGHDHPSAGHSTWIHFRSSSFVCDPWPDDFGTRFSLVAPTIVRLGLVRICV
jgi:hypothetical protein